MQHHRVILLGFILGIVEIECTINDNGVSERSDSPKGTFRFIGNPVHRNQVRKQRPGMTAPPYAVAMEPVFKYSQRDPLYDRNNISTVDLTSIKSKADYDVGQTKHVVKRVPHPNRGRRPSNPHHHRPPPKFYHSPPQAPSYPQYYPEPPEPIIEIIIKESNVSLPAPTTTPPPPTTKEPIHVFYVKYKKNPNPTDHGDEIIYENPVPALTPHQTEIVEGEQPNYGPTYAEPVGTPAPPPSTTLRTIIRPDSEVYHGSGLKVTFGGPEHDAQEAIYGQSESHPQVALPEEKESLGNNEEERSEEVRHTYSKRQQPFINKQQRQDLPTFQGSDQLYTSKSIHPPEQPQLPEQNFPDHINHRHFHPILQTQQQHSNIQSNIEYHSNRGPSPTQQSIHSSRLPVPTTQNFQNQYKSHYEQSRNPQQRRPTHDTVTDQQIQEYQRHKEFLLKQQALQSKLPSEVPPTIQSSHTTTITYQNSPLAVTQQQKQSVPHIHVEQSPIIDQPQLNQQLESFPHPPQIPKTQTLNSNYRFREKEFQQGGTKYSEWPKTQNNPHIEQAKHPFDHTRNQNEPRIPNAEIIKSISPLEEHQIHPASQGEPNPTEYPHNHRHNNQQPQYIQRVRNQPQSNIESNEFRNTRYNIRKEEEFGRQQQQQNYHQSPQQINLRNNARNNQYTPKIPSITRQQSSEERQSDISKYLTVYSRPPNASARRPTVSPQRYDNRIISTTSASTTESQQLEETTPLPKKEEETPEEQERKKANIAALPDEVPADLREQLLSSGILGNADIQILDYDKVGDIPIESLPPEALENFYGAASNPVPSIVKPDNDPKAVEMRVVRYDPNSDETITNKYFQENATKLDPVFLNDTKYKRYLPLKVSGAQFPLPDLPQLKDRTINSVVVLAPVDYDFIKSQEDPEDGRRGRIIQIQGVKFVVGDSLMTVIKKPTVDNFRRWLRNELAVPSEQQSVILLVTKGSEGGEEIWMYEVEKGGVRKLRGELSSAFVDLATSNSESEDLDRLGDGPTDEEGKSTSAERH